MGYLKLEMSHISSKLHKISRSMEKKSRYIDRERYFNELAQTSKEFYIDYIKSCKSVESHSRILEIGCGEGGNLLPFAELGCYVTGLDLAPNKIENAKAFFAKRGAEGDFRCSNFLTAATRASETGRCWSLCTVPERESQRLYGFSSLTSISE